MKRLTATWLLGALCCAGNAAAEGFARPAEFPDSLTSVWFYTEGIKQNLIERNTAEARKFFAEAIRRDSTYAPAYYELASNEMYDSKDEAVELARRAFSIDPQNKWYHQLYARSLVMADRYAEAIPVYRSLIGRYPKEPDFYRILAALYEQTGKPETAIGLIDSTEMKFGRIPILASMKRQLLVATGQIRKAIEEARGAVETTPYETEPHIVLANLYASSGNDSLARREYAAAMAIDSTDLSTLLSIADFHSTRQEYDQLLAVSKRFFLSDELPVEAKIRQFKQYTADTRFYREYYFQLNDLASILAIKYPEDKRVVELYAGHLIASGALEQALALYKSHLDDDPPVEEYYRMVIDIESYQKRADSVRKYTARALELFPDRIEFHLAKGNTEAIGGNFEAALDAYRVALEQAETDSLRSVVWGVIGDTWNLKAANGVAERGERIEAGLERPDAAFRKMMRRCYDAYARSLRYDPDNVMVLNNYAYFLSLEGRDLERALAMASRAVALENDNPTYLDTHAWVLHKLGRTDEAKKIQQRAVVLDGQNSPSMLVHYGDMLQALGERFMAEIYWRQALEKGYDAEMIERRIRMPQATPDPKK